MRVIVVDDERLARAGLQLRLAAHDDVEVVAEGRNGAEALAAVETHRPDVVFLDIEMPGRNGVDVAHRLGAVSGAPRVVFVTAYDRYAVEAFESEAVDYLLKPVTADRLAATLDRIRRDRRRRDADHQRQALLAVLRRLTGRPDLPLEEALEGTLEPDALCIEEGGSICRVPLAEIDCVEAAGDYMCARARGRTYVIRTTLTALAERLAPAGFLRIHRSVLVNLGRVREFRPNGHGDGCVYLADGSALPCSRTYRSALQKAMAQRPLLPDWRVRQSAPVRGAPGPFGKSPSRR